MSLRTFATLRDCDLKLWVDIIEQLTVLQRVGNSEFPLIPTTLCTKVKLGNVNPIFVIYFYHLTGQIRKIENQ